jgi:hypothetical protein
MSDATDEEGINYSGQPNEESTDTMHVDVRISYAKN